MLENNILDKCEVFMEKVPKQLYKIMILIFISIFALTTFVSNYESCSILVYAFILSILIIKLSRKNQNRLDSVSSTKLLIIISIICFAVKFLWIYTMRMQPWVDYATFYYSAVELSNSWVYNSKYIALFPHILGYSSFLSCFFKIFGESVFLATLLNVLLTVISGIFIFKIIENMICKTSATCAYVLWIICPSQTIYNCLVLSDPLYTTLILFFVYFVTNISKKEKLLNWIKMLFYGGIAAIILQGINVNRPIAAVLIIALFIWVFILRFKELKKKDYLKKWLSFFGVLIVIYLSLGYLWNLYFVSRIGEAPASIPGYNIYVGFNESSKGAWNKADNDLLYSYSEQEGATADWAQKQMFEEAKKRITSGSINFSVLLKNKLSVFLGKDSACVDYCKPVIKEPQYMNMICNTFYYCIIFMGVLGALKMMKISHKLSAFILPLYVIGITCAQMLVEVAPRYHYSVLPFLIMISQFYLFRRKENIILDD